jgi:putative ABC transport system permease protein
MLDDLRVSIRTLARSPGFTTMAALTLALGVAANAAIFSVVRGVLLRPLPYPEAERLVALWTSTPAAPRSSHSAGEFIDLVREQQTFTAVAGYRRDLFSTAAAGLPARRAEGAHVTAAFFDVFGVAAAAGRVFTAADAASGEPFVVLGAATAEALFPGGGEAAAGARVRVNGVPHTVLGVMPASFAWPAGTALWMMATRPVPPAPVELPETDREVRYFDAVARLRPGVTMAQARDDLDRVAGAISAGEAAGRVTRRLEIATLHEEVVGEARPAILLLQAGVAVVLLIGCANVSGLLIARTAARRRELSVRAALGARASRLIRTIVVESLVLGVAGGLAGLVLGRWAVLALRTTLPSDVPRTDDIVFDGLVAAATLGSALAASALFAAVPALHAARTDASAALRDAARGSSAGRSRSRTSLVVAEIALTLVLVVCASLLMTSLVRLQRVDAGYGTADVVTANVAIPQTRYPTSEAQTAFYARLLERLEAQPGIARSGLGFPAPLRGEHASGSFDVEGFVVHTGADRPFGHVASVSAGYFDALGVPLVGGRAFRGSDTADAPGVVIVNAELARRFWPGRDAVGGRLRFDPASPWMTVVGVVGDVRHVGLARPAPPVLYIPYPQFPLPFTTVVAVGTSEAAAASAIRAALAAVDPELGIDETRTLTAILRDATAEARFRTSIFAALGAVAVLLAAVGVYGLISHAVGQATREIGIRLALGAAPGRILGGVLVRGLGIAVGGAGLGLAAALVAARALGRFLYGVGASDPVVLGLSAAALVAVALAAAYAPARRALRVDPVEALRAE